MIVLLVNRENVFNIGAEELKPLEESLPGEAPPPPAIVLIIPIILPTVLTVDKKPCIILTISEKPFIKTEIVLSA